MKKRQNDCLSINHSQYFNTAPSDLPISTVKIEEEYKNDVNLSIDALCTTTEIKSEPAIDLSDMTFNGVSIKEEPVRGDSEDDEYSTDDVTALYENQFVANTIIKEEIIIECDPDVELFEANKSVAGSEHISENQQRQQFSKRRKKVFKNWQKDKVFDLESDALELIRNERIWTKYTTNRTDKLSKVIYRCRNVKSRGPQCEAGIYLLYSHTSPTVTLFRSINKHTCDSIGSKRKRPIKVESGAINTKGECDDSPTKTDENQPIAKRRRKIVKNWQKEKTFELEHEALAAVKIEQTWAKYTTNKTDRGNKVIYRCRNVKSRGPQCEAGVYLLYSLIDPVITLFRSINKHTCDTIDSKRKSYVRTQNRTKIKTESENVIKNDENQKKLRRRRQKVLKNWQMEKTFDLEAEALEAIKIEQKWTKYTTNKTDKGNKVIYRCRKVQSKGPQCDAGIYLLYSTNGTVTIFRSANKHTCDIIESKSKWTLNDEAKQLIRSEYEKGMKPKQIFGFMIANGFNCRQIQINNYLAQLRRDAYQSTVLTLKDFANTFHGKMKTYSKENYSEC